MTKLSMLECGCENCNYQCDYWKSKTLKPEGLSITPVGSSLEERVIEDFRDKFGNLDDKTYKIQHGDREMCMYCGYPSSRDAVFRNLEDFILKSLQQAKLEAIDDYQTNFEQYHIASAIDTVRQEYKEELLKKMPEKKGFDFIADRLPVIEKANGFNECREQVIKIIQNI